MISIIKTARFEAAHYLRDYKGKCRNVHGHSYKVEIEVAQTNGEVLLSGPNRGMVYDLAALGKILKESTEEVDHTQLNDHLELDTTTAEELAKWIARRVQVKLPITVYVLRCRVWETETGCAEWRRDYESK